MRPTDVRAGSSSAPGRPGEYSLRHTCYGDLSVLPHANAASSRPRIKSGRRGCPPWNLKLCGTEALPDRSERTKGLPQCRPSTIHAGLPSDGFETTMSSWPAATTDPFCRRGPGPAWPPRNGKKRKRRRSGIARGSFPPVSGLKGQPETASGFRRRRPQTRGECCPPAPPRRPAPPKRKGCRREAGACECRKADHRAQPGAAYGHEARRRRACPRPAAKKAARSRSRASSRRRRRRPSSRGPRDRGRRVGPGFIAMPVPDTPPPEVRMPAGVEGGPRREPDPALYTTLAGLIRCPGSDGPFGRRARRRCWRSHRRRALVRGGGESWLLRLGLARPLCLRSPRGRGSRMR